MCLDVTNLLKASAIIINNEGDSGSPCLTPWEEEKEPEGTPLIMTEKIAPEIQALTHLHHLGEKPNLRQTLNRKFQLTLSYALTISNLITNDGS
jgi:hypothetical protein